MPVSFRVESGTLVVLAGGIVAVAVVFAIGIVLGDYPLAPADVLAALVGAGTDAADFIVLELRLPRLLTGALVGAALGLSGALLQATARNPLAAPDLIGITAGASLAVVALIVLGGTVATLVPAALVGGALAAAIVLGLSWRGSLSRSRLVLIGIGVNAVCLAGVDWLLLRGQVLEVQQATVWLVGSLARSSWEDVRLLGITLALAVPATVLLARSLEALRLGDGVAASLGARVARDRLLLVAISVTAAAVAVSVAGPIAFVAFVAPHLARGLSRAAGSGILATSSVVGALIVVAADLIGRRLVAPAELPVGVFTVLVGAPYLLWMLRRASLAGSPA